MNQKPYNKCLSINLVWSVCTGKYLRRFSHCTKASGKYFPLQTSYSVNKSLNLDYTTGLPVYKKDTLTKIKRPDVRSEAWITMM